jgi:predicted dehydrogenase
MADRSIRLGFVSAAHLHTFGLLRAAFECSEARVVGLAEPDAELRSYLAGAFPGLATYETAEELYARGRPEAIVTCSDNRAAADIVADAAARGVHVMKEKPMAADLALADRMATATARARVRLMINWPTHWQSALQQAKKLVDEGAIGRVWQVHFRNGHGGPPADYATRGPIDRVGWGWIVDRERNGGGAYVDFCSYGAALSRWFMGQPSRVVALGGRYAKDFFTVEDNAILILGYPKGHSVCEGTWTQPATPVPQPLVIYGTDGAIAVVAADKLSIATRGADAAKPRIVECPLLPEHERSAPAYFVHRLLNGQPFEGLVSVDVSRDAQEILQAGLASLAEGREIGLPLRSFLTE